jgi:syntaxin 1B/2/3
MPAFYDEVRSPLTGLIYIRSTNCSDVQVTSIQEAISQFDANVNAIANLHARSLDALSEQDSATNTSQLDKLTESTRALSNEISKRIKALQAPVPSIRRQDAEIRKNRVSTDGTEIGP